jgi:hypothetical protein
MRFLEIDSTSYHLMQAESPDTAEGQWPDGGRGAPTERSLRSAHRTGIKELV